MEPLLRSGAEFQYLAEVLKPESPDWKEGSSHKEQQSGKKLYALSKAVEWRGRGGGGALQATFRKGAKQQNCQQIRSILKFCIRLKKVQ